MKKRVVLVCAAMGTLAALAGYTAWASAPADQYPVGQTTAEVVFDAKTGLTWEREVDPGSYTWSDTAAAGSAQLYCQNLTKAGGGWRLPNVRELRSLVDTSAMPPAATIDAKAFPNAPAEGFWTSTPVAGKTDGAGAWDVYFDEGGSGYQFLSKPFRVRCVR